MRYAILIILSVAIAACTTTSQIGTSTIARSYSNPPSSPADSKVVWITIDGTDNTLLSRTNAGQLYGMVDAHKPGDRKKQVVTYYADGVGSDGSVLGLATGVGMSTDIKNAFAYLTRTWKPGDDLYLSGFSRGAYGARALGGLLYSAGIPDLSRLSPKQRKQVVEAIFRAYKTSRSPSERGPTGAAKHAKRRDARIRAAYSKFGVSFPAIGDPGRAPGYRFPDSGVVVSALLAWDTVQALGKPDGRESPTEGPDHYLLTNCNIRQVFHALALDDNRVYSFTPIFADGPAMSRECPAGGSSLRANERTEEVWFAGAHADVGGTYNSDNVLDGTTPSVSLRWMLEMLLSVDASMVDPDTYISEDRLGLIHDPERDGPTNKILYRQSRKPLAYSRIAYSPNGGTIRPVKIHASVFDRLEYLFALDDLWPRCDQPNTKVLGSPLMCAKELASYSLVPELQKLGVLKATKWGYQLTAAELAQETYVKIVGSRASPKPPVDEACSSAESLGNFTGRAFEGELKNVNILTLEREDQLIPYPFCVDPE